MVDVGNETPTVRRRSRAAILAPASGPRALFLARPATSPPLTTAEGLA